MKQFVYGSNTQFSELWTRLTNGQAKRIKFDVVLPSTQSAKLSFETVSTTEVAIILRPNHEGEILHYYGQCEKLQELVHNQRILCNSSQELKQTFNEMRVDYAPLAQNENPKQRATIKGIAINTRELASKIKEQIIGQDAQVDGIVARVSNHLKKPNPKKPLTIMLPGPTGTGKTATAKCLATELQNLLGKDNFPLIVINCNEFKEEYRISQLVGSPAGYIGHDESCAMEPIRKSASSIIVFDEYEKAHPSINTAVMNWMDTGIITLSKADENGIMEYDCTKSIVIMTSNIDMQSSSSTAMKFNIDNQPNATVNTNGTQSENDTCRRVMVANGFKPEIASRISYFFEYKQLLPEDIRKIMVLTLKKKAKEYGVTLVEISDELIANIQAKYTVSSFGVRSLESDLDRIIGDQIPENVDQNAEYLASGTLDNLTITRR